MKNKILFLYFILYVLILESNACNSDSDCAPGYCCGYEMIGSRACAKILNKGDICYRQGLKQVIKFI